MPAARPSPITVDCSDEAAIKAAADQTRAEFGPIAHPGQQRRDRAVHIDYFDIDDELWDKVIRINLRGPHCASAKCCRHARGEVGPGHQHHLLVDPERHRPAQAHYVASKGGLLGLTKALALEFGASGVTFNMVPPGFIDTPMLRARGRSTSTPSPRALPMKRIGSRRGYRRRLRLSRLARSQLHHRPDDQHQRRPVHGLRLSQHPPPAGKRSSLEFCAMLPPDPPALLPPLTPDQFDEDVLKFLQRWMGGPIDPKTNPPLITFAHHPKLADRFSRLNLHLLTTSTVPLKQRQIAIMRTCWRCKAVYMWSSHLRTSVQFGLSPDMYRPIQAGPDDPYFTPFERTILIATDELVDSRR